MPAAHPAVRAQLQQELAAHGLAPLVEELHRLDPRDGDADGDALERLTRLTEELAAGVRKGRS